MGRPRSKSAIIYSGGRTINFTTPSGMRVTIETVGRERFNKKTEAYGSCEIKKDGKTYHSSTGYSTMPGRKGDELNIGDLQEVSTTMQGKENIPDDVKEGFKRELNREIGIREKGAFREKATQ